MKYIYIIRHGQTDMNLENKLQGRSDLPLNEKGSTQALEIRNYFKEQGITFDQVYSSPLTRAMETAEIMAESTTPVKTDERLIEMDYGPYEGTDLTDPPEEIITFFRDFVHNPAPDGMEQLDDVVKRAGSFLESIADAEEETILISTHAIAMKGLLEYLTPDSRGLYWSKYIGNCSVYRVEVKEGQFGLPEEIYSETV